ncbi:hypothetical protein JIN77_08160 [Verrucomicrobiaceae bacterium R5-34]|nr:hypothetical protein [Verrucomicrobiaceae bacterium R5-34]
MMRPLLLLLPGMLMLFSLMACSNDVRDWQMHDPNKNATLASELSHPRYYNSETSTTERRALEGWEERGTSGESSTRLSGELSLGVSAGF